MGNEAKATPAEAELAMRVNEMWFIERGGEPLTFREVFLKSAALENIIAGEVYLITMSRSKLSSQLTYCLDSSMSVDTLHATPAGYARCPPVDATDRELLLQLFEVTLLGDAQLHGALVDALLQLSEACRVWKEAGGTPEECLGVTKPVADAVASLKCMVCPSA